jgi:hypothetical protein
MAVPSDSIPGAGGRGGDLHGRRGGLLGGRCHCHDFTVFVCHVFLIICRFLLLATVRVDAVSYGADASSAQLRWLKRRFRGLKNSTPGIRFLLAAALSDVDGGVDHHARVAGRCRP